jgi:hypothetical protein
VTEVEDREKTLRVLVDLAVADDLVSCFSGSNAMRLLRSQSSPEELRRIGIDPETIRQVWPEESDE